MPGPHMPESAAPVQACTCRATRMRSALAAWICSMDSSQYLAEIIPGLYLGNLRSLFYLEQLQITHVLSVVNFPVRHDLSHLQSIQIKIPDYEDTNLLEHLPTALNFVHTALTGKQLMAPADLMGPTEDEDEAGKETDGSGASPNASETSQPLTATAPSDDARPVRVLVHCQAGMSRSASVVIAYIMKTKSLDFEEALSFVRSKWVHADPNEGFRAQLEVFYEMKYSLNPDHAVYRLQQFWKQHEEDGYVDPDSFAVLPEDGEASSSKVPLYRCRKCRKLLATARNVLSQSEVAAGHKVFLTRKRLQNRSPAETDAKQAAAGVEGSSLFLEPMQWMSSAVVGQVQGKLYCPGCNARLGSFDWSGITNEHGQWVTPAFQIHVNKVDVVTPRGTVLPASGPMGARISIPQQVRQQPLVTGIAAAAAAGTQPALAASADSTASTVDTGDTPLSVLTVDPQATENGTTVQLKPADEMVQQSALGAAWFTHLVLDCDGVMVDSERASCESLRRSILKVTGFDIPHDFPHDYYEVFGMDVRSCVEHYKAKFNRQDWNDTELLAQKVQAVKEGIYMELTQELGIKAFPGARPLIAEARALGLPVGIASSGAPAKIAHNLGSSGLLGLVEDPYIVSAAYVQRGKPAPDVYVEALKRLGCTEPGRALVVEDAVNGLKAARAAGAFCVAVTTSLPRETLAPYADLVLDDLVQLVGMLRTLRPDAIKQVVAP